MTPNNRKILISGAGIAGPTLAYWLRQHGYEPLVVEQAPGPREGGYLIDFRGTGIDVAERMGVMDRVRARAYVLDELRVVNASNAAVARVDIARLFRETFDDPRRAQTQIMRSDLARILYEQSKGGAECVFGDSIRAMREEAGGVAVDFERGESRRFDLVIGADGVHSNVRALSFGEERRFARYLGHHLASYFIDYPIRAGTNVAYSEPGRFISLWGFPGNRAMVYAQFRQPEKLRYDPRDSETQKRLFADTLGDVRWDAMPAVLGQLSQARDFFFDSASEIRMDRWSNGRISARRRRLLPHCADGVGRHSGADRLVHPSR